MTEPSSCFSRSTLLTYASVIWMLASRGGLLSAAKSLASIQPTAAQMEEEAATITTQSRIASRGLVRFFFRFFFFLPVPAGRGRSSA